MKLMGYEILEGSLSSLDLGKKQIVNTINPHSYVTAKRDELFSQALLESDVLIPDGSGIVLAAKQINKVKVDKISGSDLHKFILDDLNKKGGKVFYMGASKETLQLIEHRIGVEYNNVKVSSYSPPYADRFSESENIDICNKINAFAPDVLFIGMTAPKQEKWLNEHKDVLTFTTAHCIGAVFDFYSGTVTRPSQIWVMLHLEWLGRLISEPRRMWKRNFISTPIFLFDMLLYRMGVKK